MVTHFSRSLRIISLGVILSALSQNWAIAATGTNIITGAFRSAVDQESFDRAVQIARHEIVFDERTNPSVARSEQNVESLQALRADTQFRAQLEPSLQKPFGEIIDWLLSSAVNDKRVSVDLREQVIDALEKEAMSVTSQSSLASMSNVIRLGGQQLGVSSLNVLRGIYSLAALEALHRVRLAAQARIQSPATEMLFVYKLAWSEMILSQGLPLPEAIPFMQNVFVKEGALPHQEGQNNDGPAMSRSVYPGYEILESSYINYLEAKLEIFALKNDNDFTETANLLIEIRDNALYLAARALADDAILELDRFLVDKSKAPLEPVPPENFVLSNVDFAPSPAINGTLTNGKTVVLKGDESASQLQKIDWDHLTFHIEEKGTQNLLWLNEYQFDSARNRQFTAKPGSRTHQLIVKDLLIRAQIRDLPTDLKLSEPNFWMSPIDVRTEFIIKQVLQTSDYVFRDKRFNGTIMIPENTQARLVMFQALAEFNRLHPDYQGVPVDKAFNVSIIHGEVYNTMARLHAKAFGLPVPPPYPMMCIDLFATK